MYGMYLPSRSYNLKLHIKQIFIVYFALSFRYRSKEEKQSMKIRSIILWGAGRKKSVRLHEKDIAFELSLEECVQG